MTALSCFPLRCAGVCVHTCVYAEAWLVCLALACMCVRVCVSVWGLFVMAALSTRLLAKVIDIYSYGNRKETSLRHLPPPPFLRLAAYHTPSPSPSPLPFFLCSSSHGTRMNITFGPKIRNNIVRWHENIFRHSRKMLPCLPLLLSLCLCQFPWECLTASFCLLIYKRNIYVF